MLSGDNGILQKATDAKTKSDEAQIKERIRLAYNSALTKDITNQNGEVQKSTLEDELENEFPNKTIEIADSADKKEWIITIDGVVENVPIGKDTSEEPKTTLKVAEHKNEKFSTNTELEDIFGNKITVPAGFKITSDSPSSVTGGIVIEDVEAGTTATAGSQFVWIPVGKIYTDTEKTETNAKNIELCRCGFNESGEKVTVEEGWEYELTKIEGTMPPPIFNQYSTCTFTEETESRVGSLENNINATAKNLSDFLSKASKGYYIGRYEARTTSPRTASGDATTVVTEKAEDSVYNYVTQLQASEQSRNMYSSSNFESDLMNSYAWDTAILFLQEFDDRTDKSKKYSLQTSLNNSLSSTGTTVDKICNIYDMASNCREYTTETCNSTGYPCVGRGGVINVGYYWTARRDRSSTSNSNNTCSFRPVIYVK